MSFKDKKAIIFDLDGTLVDSVPDLTIAINHMLKTINHKTVTEDTIRLWVGNGLSTLVKRALKKDDIDKKALEVFLKFYAQNLAVKTKLYPHVKDTLEKLHSSGFLLVVVTNKPYAFIEPIMKKLEIENFFEFYLGADSLKEKKPHPMPLLHACKKLSIEPSECVMVGDSKNDILAAKEANMQSIGLSYGYNYAEDISIYEPDFVFDDFASILKAF
jgi:phosphoglycolate phosphatase